MSHIDSISQSLLFTFHTDILDFNLSQYTNPETGWEITQNYLFYVDDSRSQLETGKRTQLRQNFFSNRLVNTRNDLPRE